MNLVPPAHQPVYRVLGVDDDPAMRAEFARVLGGPDALQRYQLDLVDRGPAALVQLEAALALGRPYALALVEMRPAQGWDGVETTRRLWQVDPSLQVVLCTDQGDHSWSEIRRQLPASDRFLILRKPFDDIELLQLAAALCERRRTEARLVEQHHVLAEAQAAARMGWFSCAADGSRWRHAAMLDEMFGCPGASAPRAWRQGLLPLSRKALRTALARSRQTGEPIDLLCAYQRPRDGRRLWLRVRGHWEGEFSDGPEAGAHLIGSVQDVSADYLAREQLQLLEASVARINDVVLIAHADSHSEVHRIGYANAAFERVTGLPVSQAIGRTAWEIAADPVNEQVLRQLAGRVESGESARAELFMRHASGSGLWLEADVVPLPSGAGQRHHWVAVLRDVTAHKQVLADAQRQALYDPLTGLPNRRLLDDRLQRQILACARTPSYCGLIFIDLDDFKQINDRYGHEAGDLVLVEVAQRLSQSVREEDTVARLGGDEFVVLLRNLGADADSASAHAGQIAGKLVDRLALPLPGPLGGVTASVGLTLFGRSPTSVTELLHQADLAMYQAKTAGKNAHAWFAPSEALSDDEADFLAGQLRHAAARGQLSLRFQPRVDDTGQVSGAEALLRWQCPQRGEVPPAIFLPLAERLGLLPAISDWALAEACATLAGWAAEPTLARLEMVVNLSASQLTTPGLAERVAELLERSGAAAGRLLLDLPNERAALVHPLAQGQCCRLQALGVRLSLDDRGEDPDDPVSTAWAGLAQGEAGDETEPDPGPSELSWCRILAGLPLSELKVARSVVRDLGLHGSGLTRLRRVIRHAGRLGLGLAASGVETEVQHRLLVESGCQQLQGYLHGQPMTLRDLAWQLALGHGSGERMTSGDAAEAEAGGAAETEPARLRA
ncbi:MAG: hypothetical protein RL722_492 [Pseudomonadota bacterium]